MPILGFSREFAELIRSGEKLQTLRPPRRDAQDPRPGRTLYFYCGGYSAGRTKLGEATCTAVRPVLIRPSGVWIEDVAVQDPHEFARADGFSSWGALYRWLASAYGVRGKLPGNCWRGLLIEWEAVVPGSPGPVKRFKSRRHRWDLPGPWQVGDTRSCAACGLRLEFLGRDQPGSPRAGLFCDPIDPEAVPQEGVGSCPGPA